MSLIGIFALATWCLSLAILYGLALWNIYTTMVTARGRLREGWALVGVSFAGGPLLLPPAALSRQLEESA